MNTEIKGGNGIGFLTVLFLIFLTLKLADVGVVANWSWWWVAAPIWMPLAFLLIVCGLAVIVVLVTKGR